MKRTKQTQSNEVIRALIRESLYRLYSYIRKATVKYNLTNTYTQQPQPMGYTNIQKSIKEQFSEFKVFLDYINNNVMKLSHNNPDILLTGQIVASWVLFDFNIKMHYNDVDVFVLDTTPSSDKIKDVGFVPTVNRTHDSSEYIGLFKGYSIITSVKVIRRSVLNAVAVTPKTQDLYNVYNDDQYNYKKFAENIVGTFDLNLNKIGILTNKWLTEFNPIISDDFVEFIATRQYKLTHSLNSKFLIRYYDKLHRIKDEIRTKKLYFNENDILDLLGIQNQIHNRLATQSQFDSLAMQDASNAYRISPVNSSLYSELPKLDSLIRNLLVNQVRLKFNIRDHVEYTGHFNFKIGFDHWHRSSLLSDDIQTYCKAHRIPKNEFMASGLIHPNLAIEYMYSFVSKAKVEAIISHLLKRKITNSCEQLYSFIGTLVRFPSLLNYQINQIREVAKIVINHTEFAAYLEHQSRENTIQTFDSIIALNEYIESEAFDNYRDIITKNSKVTYIYNMLKKYRHYPLSVMKSELLAWVEVDFEDATKSLVNRDPIEFSVNGDVQVSELTSTMELTREGEVMNHCVGGYTSLVRSKRTLIFRITSNSDETLRYTFELKLKCPDNILVLVQVRGKRNIDVSEMHRDVVNTAISRAIKMAGDLDICSSVIEYSQPMPACDEVFVYN